MKDQTSLETVDIVSESVEQEEQIPPKKLVSDSRDAANRIESDEDSGFLNLSNSSLDTCEDNVNKNTDDFVSVDEEPEQQLESQPWKLKIVPKSNILSEEDLINKSKELVSKLQEMPEENRKEFAFETYQKVFDKLLPDNLVEISAAFYFDGDSGISMDVRPDWLDMEKFRRGQRFARDYMFGLNYSQLLSLFVIFSFTDGLRTLIATGASSTPYTSFKRYLSTALRIQNWYMYDPWTRDTPAYKDLQTVRKMHAMSRKKMETMSKEEIIRKTTIKDAWCPALNFTRRDFQSTCPAPKANQCAYTIFDKNPKLKAKEINQGEMISTQFSFIGIFILNPKFFGVHYACDEDLEAYCHVWRGIGYLLGIDDHFNFCRGTLEDIKSRSRNFLNYWAKPNFRKAKPEWEHMMRCIIEGLQYYFPGSTYETCLLDLAETLDLHMPRLYNSMSYSTWIKRNIIRFYFTYASRFPGFRSLLNYRLEQAIERAKNFDEEKHKQLQQKSARTLESYAMQIQSIQKVAEKPSK